MLHNSVPRIRLTYFYKLSGTINEYANSRWRQAANLNFYNCKIYPQLLTIACRVKQIESVFDITSQSNVISIILIQNGNWRPFFNFNHLKNYLTDVHHGFLDSTEYYEN